MKYYKHIVNNEVVGYVSSPEVCVDSDFIQISEEEYIREIELLAVEEIE